MVYISVIIAHILQITIFHMLDLCVLLSSTPFLDMIIMTQTGILEKIWYWVGAQDLMVTGSYQKVRLGLYTQLHKILKFSATNLIF